MELTALIFTIVFTLFWIFGIPMVITFLIITTSDILFKKELIKEELYERLSDDFTVPPVAFICWWILLGFFGGFSYVPFFS